VRNFRSCASLELAEFQHARWANERRRLPVDDGGEQSRWSDDGALASIVLPDDDGVCLKRDRMVTKAPIVL